MVLIGYLIGLFSKFNYIKTQEEIDRKLIAEFNEFVSVNPTLHLIEIGYIERVTEVTRRNLDRRLEKYN